jgi:hypothetical protein
MNTITKGTGSSSNSTIGSNKHYWWHLEAQNLYGWYVLTYQRWGIHQYHTMRFDTLAGARDFIKQLKGQ